MRYRVNIAALCAWLLPSALWAANFKSWEWNIPTSSSGSWSASETSSSASVNGTYTRNSNNSFLKLVVEGGSGSGIPSNGTSKYGLEAPGFSMFVEPTLSDEKQLITTAVSGSCPTYPWTGNFIFSHWPDSGYDMTGNIPAYGHFTWTPATNTLRLDSVYKLTSHTLLGSNVDIAGTCDAGVITLSGTGDRGGIIYISNRTGSVYVVNTAANAKLVYAVPDNAIPSLAQLDGNYSAYGFDHGASPSIIPYTVVFDSAGSDKIWFKQLTSIDSDTVDNDTGWKITNIQINNPGNGMLRGQLVRRSGGSDTSYGGTSDEILCTVYLTTKTVLACITYDKGGSDETLPRTFTLVSRTQAYAASTEDAYAFNSTGRIDYSLPGYTGTYLSDIVLQSDGKLVAAGTAGNGEDYGMTVIRYLPSGTIDTSFGTSGTVRATFETGTGEASRVALQSDGKIIVGGNGVDVNVDAIQFGAMRFHTNGVLDTSFGTNGKALVSISGYDNYVYAMTIQADDRIVLAGSVGNTSNHGTARFTANGILDTTWGTNGKTNNNLGGIDYPEANLSLSNGKVLSTGAANGDLIVVRYNSNGTLDSTFGTNGRRIATVYDNSYGYAIALQPDSKIVVAGEVYDSVEDYTNQFLVMRFTTNGAIDTAFGTSGFVKHTPSLDAEEYATYLGVAVQTDGKIVAAGSLYGGSTARYVVGRYSSSGDLDTTFGTNGLYMSVLTAQPAYDLGIALQNDGKIIFGSSEDFLSYSTWLIRRLWP